MTPVEWELALEYEALAENPAGGGDVTSTQ